MVISGSSVENHSDVQANDWALVRAGSAGLRGSIEDIFTRSGLRAVGNFLHNLHMDADVAVNLADRLQRFIPELVDSEALAEFRLSNHENAQRTTLQNLHRNANAVLESVVEKFGDARQLPDPRGADIELGIRQVELADIQAFAEELLLTQESRFSPSEDFRAALGGLKDILTQDLQHNAGLDESICTILGQLMLSLAGKDEKQSHQLLRRLIKPVFMQLRDDQKESLKKLLSGLTKAGNKPAPAPFSRADHHVKPWRVSSSKKGSIAFAFLAGVILMASGGGCYSVEKAFQSQNDLALETRKPKGKGGKAGTNSTGDHRCGTLDGDVVIMVVGAGVSGISALLFISILMMEQCAQPQRVKPPMDFGSKNFELLVQMKKESQEVSRIRR